MKNFKKIVLIILISSIMIIPCFSYNYTSGTDCGFLFVWDYQLNEEYKYDLKYNDTWSNRTVRNLTKNFCDKVKPLKCSTLDWNTDYFDASQSVFLAILCNSLSRDWLQDDTRNTYLKKKNFVQFDIISSNLSVLEPCYFGGSMNDCDYSYALPLIFNTIMNDFFSIKQARNLWLTWLKSSVDAAANTFSIEAFPWLSLQKWLENGICDPNSPYYKTTCKTLKGYMKDGLSLLKSTKVIDVEKLPSSFTWKDCDISFAYNIPYCGLLWSDSDYKFINTVYNEYLWYNLFLSYYAFYIDGKDFLGTFPREPAERLATNKEKIYLVQNQVLKSKQAITSSLKTLAEIKYSFPLHVWFLMYNEDAKLFMKNISKIYAPLRTLYDKLRNVQIKES